MKELGFTTEDFERISEDTSQAFSDALVNLGMDFTFNYLMLGMPSKPKHIRDIIDGAMVTAVTWALANGWVELSEKGESTVEERAERKAEDVTTVHKLNPADMSTPRIGQYL